MAIGVSHLMQATRAGAGFGFGLIGLVIAVNLAKYPFFEYGHRYAAATGESLLHGYRRLGRGAVLVFLVIHVITAVIGIAAIVFVTSALAQNLIGFGLGTTVLSALLISASIALVVIGRFRGLDLVIRIMVAVLVVATMLALGAAVWHGPVAPDDFRGQSPWQAVHLGFLIALMGWMPAPIDVSIFQSLWLVARDEVTCRRTTLDEARFDFNFGYVLTTGMAVAFVALGALVMYGSGQTFAASNAGFATQLVGIYATTLGGWIGPIMAVVALVAMLTTTLTAIDASPRALSVAQGLVQRREPSRPDRLHTAWMIGVGLAALIIIYAFRARFTQFVDLVTTISFLTAPVFAVLNMRVMASNHVPDHARPGSGLKALAVVGLVFLVAFGLLYVVARLGLFSR